MMGTITIVLSDELEREIRERIAKGGKLRKGALSEFIENAVKMYLETLERRETVFKAEKNGRIIAQATTLKELARKLKEKGIDPRQVRIIAHPTLSLEKRIGLRGKRIR